MTGEVRQAILAGLVVNQIENECPHDRTPLSDQRAKAGRASFRANVADQGKRLRAAVKLFLRRAGDETSSRDREVNGRCGKDGEPGARDVLVVRPAPT